MGNSTKALLDAMQCQNSVLVTDNQQDQAPVFGDDECTTGPNTLNGK